MQMLCNHTFSVLAILWLKWKKIKEKQVGQKLKIPYMLGVITFYFLIF